MATSLEDQKEYFQDEQHTEFEVVVQEEAGRVDKASRLKSHIDIEHHELAWTIEELRPAKRPGWRIKKLYNYLYHRDQDKKPRDLIIKGIVGVTRSGELTALMGPSGCGKTSLLDCLSLRNRNFRGALLLDGQPTTGDYFTMSGYVPQAEMFFAFQTVEEHLIFHAMASMRGRHSKEECMKRVEEVLNEVKLQKCRQHIIGGDVHDMIKGISGGERKRLAIATELLEAPRILFLDEPTSGLDSVMGERVIGLLQSLAHDRIIITSLHTPSSRVFRMYTNVLLLTSTGQLAYHGTRAGMLAYFNELGFRCPADFSPPDFVLELLSTKCTPDVDTEDEEASDTGSNETWDTDDVMPNRLAEAFDRVVEKNGLRLESISSHYAFQSVTGGATSAWQHFTLNLWRSWLEIKRDWFTTAFIAITISALGLLTGMLFLGKVQGSWRNTIGFFLVISVSNVCVPSMQVCLSFPTDFPKFLREYYAGKNSVLGYFMGRTIADMPRVLLHLPYVVIQYGMVGLAPEPLPFLRFLLINFLAVMASVSVGYMCSSFSANPSLGLALVPVLATPMILFSGVLYERSTVPDALRWAQSTSIVNYSIQGLMTNHCWTLSPAETAPLLAFLEITGDKQDFRSSVIGLIFIAVGYRLLACLFLFLRVRSTKPI